MESIKNIKMKYIVVDIIIALSINFIILFFKYTVIEEESEVSVQMID